MPIRFVVGLALSFEPKNRAGQFVAGNALFDRLVDLNELLRIKRSASGGTKWRKQAEGQQENSCG
jgi:hypothetical protein